MSTQPVHEDESPSLAVARRLRMLLAGQNRRITQVSLARAIGMTPASLSKKLNAIQAFSVDELFQIADATNIPLSWILGLNETTPSPIGDGVVTVRPPGLEPGTHWLTPDAEEGAEILPFEPQDVPLAPAQECGQVIPLDAYREAATEPLGAPLAAVVQLFGPGL